MQRQRRYTRLHQLPHKTCDYPKSIADRQVRDQTEYTTHACHIQESQCAHLVPQAIKPSARLPSGPLHTSLLCCICTMFVPANTMASRIHTLTCIHAGSALNHRHALRNHVRSDALRVFFCGVDGLSSDRCLCCMTGARTITPALWLEWG